MEKKSDNYYITKGSFVILSLMIALFLATLNLPCSGDVESNPGPTYSIVKIISRWFNQGNPRGYTAGI